MTNASNIFIIYLYSKQGLSKKRSISATPCSKRSKHWKMRRKLLPETMNRRRNSLPMTSPGSWCRLVWQCTVIHIETQIELPLWQSALKFSYFISTFCFQLRQEKCELEETLEKEQEYQVNKLMRKIEKLEAETLSKQTTLEQVSWTISTSVQIYYNISVMSIYET